MLPLIHFHVQTYDGSALTKQQGSQTPVNIATFQTAKFCFAQPHVAVPSLLTLQQVCV
jgi:hypothetical protein